jgi:hypothetical protein
MGFSVATYVLGGTVVLMAVVAVVIWRVLDRDRSRDRLAEWKWQRRDSKWRNRWH